VVYVEGKMAKIRRVPPLKCCKSVKTRLLAPEANAVDVVVGIKSGPYEPQGSTTAKMTKEGIREVLDQEASQRWLGRVHFDLVGHDKAFFADQGDSAVEQRCIGIVVANQFSSIHRTDDRGSIHFEIEMIPL